MLCYTSPFESPIGILSIATQNLEIHRVFKFEMEN